MPVPTISRVRDAYKGLMQTAVYMAECVVPECFVPECVVPGINADFDEFEEDLDEFEEDLDEFEEDLDEFDKACAAKAADDVSVKEFELFIKNRSDADYVVA